MSDLAIKNIRRYINNSNPRWEMKIEKILRVDNGGSDIVVCISGNIGNSCDAICQHIGPGTVTIAELPKCFEYLSVHHIYD